MSRGVTEAMAWAFACEFTGVNTATWFEQNKADLMRALAAALVPPEKEGEAQPVALLRELVNRTENFWALIQGEYGVRLSDDDDHNVVGFFSALEDANKFLASPAPSDPSSQGSGR